MNVYSSGIGEAVQGVSIDSTRRVFNFGDRVAELAPMESPFFVYLSKVAKKPTDDPVFKFLEQRHQWQRRNAVVAETVAAANVASGGTIKVKVIAPYDKYGRLLGGVKEDTAGYAKPEFFLPGQEVTIKAGTGTSAGIHRMLVTAVDSATVDSFGGGSDTGVACVELTLKNRGASTINIGFAQPVFASDTEGNGLQVSGSAFAEGSGAPEGWMDALYNREGYTQIFKTSCPMFTGSSLATRYRGIPNEWTRVWGEKMKEHKMDLEHASLYGVGRYEVEDGTGPKRYTWGMLPYTENFGKVYDFTYNASNYDSFVDAMEDFYAPESGNSSDKLVLASRKILGWFQKLQSASFLKNTVGASQYRMSVDNIPGAFGHAVTRVSTIFGNLHFVQEPLLRGLYEDYAIAIDLKNVAWRPLSANGVSRDTHVITNVQDNDVDGRKDMILTEAGLEIQLPETHAILKWA